MFKEVLKIMRVVNVTFLNHALRYSNGSVIITVRRRLIMINKAPILILNAAATMAREIIAK